MPECREVTARHYVTGSLIRVAIEGPTLIRVEPAEETGLGDGLEPWIAPALWDIQVNGRWGLSFSDLRLTAAGVEKVVQAQAGLGVSRFCPTLMTASPEAMIHGVRAIAQACDANPEINRRVLGIHLEGPWISAEEGYRGAHPAQHARTPSWSEFEALQRASGSRIVLVTLAPEWPGSLKFIAALAEAGVVVAIGHSAADPARIALACEAGLRLATHLGNGVPAFLPRHPNPILSQAAEDRLAASFIADGEHVDEGTLRLLVRVKTPSNTLFISDASPLAGSPPGGYGPWQVLENGRIVVSGTPYLAGSNLSLFDGMGVATRATGMTLAEAIDCASLRPARLLDRIPPSLDAGQPADLILYRRDRGRLDGDGDENVLMATCVGGVWTIVED